MGNHLVAYIYILQLFEPRAGRTHSGVRSIQKYAVYGDPIINRTDYKRLTFVKDRLGHDQRYAIDPTKITNALGWYPETKFEVGIVKTIEWYLNNQEWVEEVTSGDYQKYYERMYSKR